MQLRMIDELLLHAYYTSHRQQPMIDDRGLLRHPVEEEMMRCIASGISLDDFIVDWVYSHPTSSVPMLRRRWFKVLKLARIYTQYSNPILDTTSS